MTTGAHRHGPHGGIFLRTFLGFLALTLATVLLFTFFLTATLQAERQAAYEDEVRAQAREVAGYVSHLNQLQFVFESSTMRYVLLSRCRPSMTITTPISGSSATTTGRLIYQFLDSGGNIVDPRYISSERCLRRLPTSIRATRSACRAWFPELGEDIVTIGVPWRYSDGHVVGRGCCSTSPRKICACALWTCCPLSCPWAWAVLILGVFLFAFCWARSLTRPLKEITAAVRDFFPRAISIARVQLTCGGELQALGDEIDPHGFRAFQYGREPQELRGQRLP